MQQPEDGIRAKVVSGGVDVFLLSMEVDVMTLQEMTDYDTADLRGNVPDVRRGNEIWVKVRLLSPEVRAHLGVKGHFDNLIVKALRRLESYN